MRPDAGELAADVEERLDPKRQGRAGDHAGDPAIVLPRHAGEVLGVVRREPGDRQRPTATVARVGEGLDQCVAEARGEPAALTPVVARIRAEVHGRGQAVADAEADHALGGPVGQLVAEVGLPAGAD